MKNCRSDDIAYETAFAKKDCAKLADFCIANQKHKAYEDTWNPRNLFLSPSCLVY